MGKGFLMEALTKDQSHQILHTMSITKILKSSIKKKKKKNPIKLTVPWLTTDGLIGLETSRGGAMFKGGGQNFEILKIYIIILMFSKFSLQK